MTLPAGHVKFDVLTNDLHCMLSNVVYRDQFVSEISWKFENSITKIRVYMECIGKYPQSY